MPAPCTQDKRSRPRGWWLLACLLASWLTSGCQGARFYKATEVPTEYLARGVENVQTLDLSRLAGHAANSQQIAAGDLLEVAIETGYADQVDKAMVRVADDGQATIPLVGRVALAGFEPETAERIIAGVAVERGLYRNPAVTIDVRRQRTNRVTVIGAVESPDVYELPSGSCSLLSAIVAAGGLNEHAGTSVEIRRSAAGLARRPSPERVTPAGFQQPAGAVQPASYKVDLVDAARQSQTNYPLEDGDVVMVEKHDPQPFDVLGLVSKPGRFELPSNKDVRVLDALAMAGGTSTVWADKAHLIRHVPGEDKPIVVDISIKEAKQQGKGNLRLAPGDVVSVEQTPRTLVTGTLRAIAPYSIPAIIPFIR
jgi:polysaccharide export outer membrane protein